MENKGQRINDVIKGFVAIFITSPIIGGVIAKVLEELGKITGNEVVTYWILFSCLIGIVEFVAWLLLTCKWVEKL